MLNKIQKQLLSSTLPSKLNDIILDLPTLSEDRINEIHKQISKWKAVPHAEHINRIEWLILDIEERIETENHRASLYYHAKEKFDEFFLPSGEFFNKMFDKMYLDIHWTGDASHHDQEYAKELSKQFDLDESEAKLALQILLDCNPKQYRDPKSFMQ